MKKFQITENDRKRLKAIVFNFNKAKVLTLGDFILDEFIWGKVDRISPEAPVPVVDVTKQTYVPGGSLNTAYNIKTLGGDVLPCGVLGRDLWGKVLAKEIKKSGVETGGVIYDPKRPTTLKTRVIANSQQVVRFDREKSDEISTVISKQLLSFIKKKIKSVDCVLIEDYGKGVITPKLLKQVMELAKKEEKIITVDPKEDNISLYKGASTMTPNLKEAYQILGVKKGKLSHEEVGTKLMRRFQLKSLLLTLGEQGMMLFEKNNKVTKIPTTAQEVFDVSGAGDTVIAVFSLALSCRAKLKDAAILSNLAAGIVVGKMGTACVSQEELIDAIERVSFS